MTTSYFPFTLMPVLSEIGKIVVGAKMYFYLTETLTLAPIYDADGSPLANPMVADLDGRFPSAYLDDSIVYRVRLFNAAGVQLGEDIDPYEPTGYAAGQLIPVIDSLTSFSQSESFSIGTLGRHAQYEVYFQDPPFLAAGDGTTDDSTSLSDGISFAQTRRCVIQGVAGSIYKVGSTVSASSAPFSMVGAANEHQQVGSIRTSVTFRGTDTGPMFAVIDCGGSVFKDFAVENTGTHTDGFSFNTNSIFLTFDGINATGSTPFSRSLYYFNGGTAYLKFINHNVLSSATPVMIYLDGDDSAPMELLQSREIAAVDGNDLTVVYANQSGIESFVARDCTFDSYPASELTVVDTDASDQIVGYGPGYAHNIIALENCEIDQVDPPSTGRLIRASNVAIVKMSTCTVQSQNGTSLIDAYNSTVFLEKNTFSSLSGYVVNVRDLESAVAVLPGNNLNPASTVGYFNPTVTLPGSSFTASTVSTGSDLAKHTITVTAATDLLYPGQEITGTNIPARTWLMKQLSGTKGRVGTYLISKAATGTGTGLTLSQPSGTYPTNCGSVRVLPMTIGADTYYIIESRQLSRGIDTFRIEVESGDSNTFTVYIADPSDPPLFMGGNRQANAPLTIQTVNKSGGALGTVFLGTAGAPIIVSGGVWPSPANGFTSTISIAQKVVGATSNYQQTGASVATIPNV